jgi:hypothetical protein
MTEIHVKPGVVFKRFTPALIRMLGALESIALEGRGLVPGMPDELVITSANDGTHSALSRHYRDEALDVRTKSFPNRASKDQFRMALQCKLGPKFTVLLENEGGAQEHAHIQVRKGGTYP